MLPKRFVVGIGVVALVLGSFLGVACDDDEDNGDGGTTPAAEEPTDTPEADATP